jgi:phosphoglycolate phosphatase
MPSATSFAVAFDLDGTLFSSEAILGRAYEVAVAEANRRWSLGLETPRLSTILALVGRPVAEILASLFPAMPAEKRHDFSTLVLDDLVAQIRARKGAIFDGVTETLAELRRRGHPLAVVSNCRRAYLEAILGTYDLMGFFESAACNEDDPSLGKNGFLKILLAGRAGVMVGDRISDGVAARFAGVKWIGCSFGHAEETEKELEAADATVHSFPEILPIIEGWAVAE